MRVPTDKEEKMIVEYVLKTFQTKVSINRLANDKAEINIKGRQRQQDVQQWAPKLNEFLSKNYPDEWEDSIDQHC